MTGRFDGGSSFNNPTRRRDVMVAAKKTNTIRTSRNDNTDQEKEKCACVCVTCNIYVLIQYMECAKVFGSMFLYYSHSTLAVFCCHDINIKKRIDIKKSTTQINIVHHRSFYAIATGTVPSIPIDDTTNTILNQTPSKFANHTMPVWGHEK